MRLEGKTSVVTGAGSGIGQAIALRFSREGARVLIHSKTEAHARETAAAIEALGAERPPIVSGSIESVKTSERLSAVVKDAFSVLDVLVTSAGVDDFHQSISSQSTFGTPSSPQISAESS